MKTIWKYYLDPDGKVDIPKGGEILCVQAQREMPCIWVLVVSEQEYVERRLFNVFFTGQKMPENYKGAYIGTCQLDGGRLVVHVFESI